MSAAISTSVSARERSKSAKKQTKHEIIQANKEAESDILARLNVIAEYQTLGVRFSSPDPDKNGWAYCHAADREDRNASAGVNTRTGYYHDFGGGGTRHSLWEFAALHSPQFTDWQEARRHYAEKTGIELRGGTKKNPAKDLTFRDDQPEPTDLWRTWCVMCKPGVTVEALRLAGAKHAIYKQHWPVIALPIYSAKPTLNTSSPCGWVMLPYLGKLPIFDRRGDITDWKKMKTTFDSDAGVLLSAVDAEALSDPTGPARAKIETLWKVEGVPDLLAFLAARPADLAGRVIPVTNSGGSSEDPKRSVLALFDDIPTRIVGDADEPGQFGAAKWIEKVSLHARETRNVRLPYEVQKSRGQDLRDYFNDGYTYHDLVDLAADAKKIPKNRPPFSNYFEYEFGETTKIDPRPLTDIATELLERTSDWPRRIGTDLFVSEDDRIIWIQTPSQLFAWIRSRLDPIEWMDKKDMLVKRGELFDYLRQKATHYEHIEHAPHHPVFADTYYTCEFPVLKSPDDSPLTRLIELFSPAEKEDEALIIAMLMTLFWGGPAGQRPVFVVTSDDGPGSGKTTLSQIAGRLAGGYFDFSQSDKPEDIRKQMLSPGGLTKRIARIDNIKTHKFSWGSLESLITADTIEGWRVYSGNAARPNRLTWLLTVNGASLSKDMAERSVVIKLRKPATYTADWQVQLSHLLDEHADDLVAELLDLLRLDIPEAQPLVTRWPRWETEILCRLIQGPQLQRAQALMKQRGADVDVDAEEHDTFEEFVEKKLKGLGYNVNECNVHVPNEVMSEWWKKCFDEHKSSIAVSRHLTQIANQNCGFKKIRVNPSRKHGRGFLFQTNENFSVDYELEHKKANSGF